MSHIQNETIGFGQFRKLNDIIGHLNFDAIFIVCGKQSFERMGLKQAFHDIFSNKQLTFFNEYTENPKFEDVLLGMKHFIDSNAEIIIAIGGGSAMDTAKSINHFKANSLSEKDALSQDNELHLKRILCGESTADKEGVPLIAIPTTAGTGSESTHFSVVYLDGKKYSLAHQSMLPSVIVLDAELTLNKPAYLTACTAFDALCQAVESLWSVGATEESMAYSSRAIPLILDNLPILIEQLLTNVFPIEKLNRHENERQSLPLQSLRENLLIAANLAGKAINIAKTTAPHAISYTITSEYNIPHGHAVALTLGEFAFALLSKHDPDVWHYPKGLKQKRRIEKQLYSLFKVEDAQSFLTAWHQLMDRCGLKRGFSNVGIDNKSKIEHLVAQINVERLSNFPLKVSTKEILEILEQC